ncbi:pentapeptide repeat-containing protein [Streptomyces sp. NPDC002812]|uniref:pentapeptide repeat-containing protein n=1 Tax=Streptomyces sp. NPDC002812 TaxID=3154434 RepID=UPI0033239D0E
MKQILLDAPDQSEDAARVLQAFIHEHTEPGVGGSEEGPSPDVAFAIEALGKAVPHALHIVRLPKRNLQGVNLGGMTLRYATFSGSILRRVNLQFSVLNGGYLDGVDATGAIFRHASLARVGLSDANLSVCLLDFADFTAARMDKADLTGAQAEGAIFLRAGLSRAKISGTFTRCDFRRANLVDADLTAFSGPESDFQGARLRGANLTAADLSTARGLTVDQVLEARISGSTLLPEYLRADERVVRSVRPAES